MKQPKIRFNGFSDEWVEKKLGDVSKIQTGSSNAKDASDQGEYPFYIRSDDVKRSNKYLFDGEAILIPGEGRIGEIFHYANGKFDFHQRVYAISSFQELCGMYLLNVLRKNFGHHAKKYSVKATVDSLRLPIIQQFPIQLPTLPEQQKIGALFSKYDAIIALREQKLEELNALKKGMLQQMFDDGHKLQVRFSGFNDEWVEKRLGDVLLCTASKKFISNGQVGTKYPVIQQGDDPIKEFSDQVPFTDFEDVVLFGDHTRSLYKPNMPFLLATDGIKILSSKFIKGNYLSYLILKHVPESQGYKRHLSILKNQDVSYSRDLNEQQKIGQLFKQLDARISNEQTKIEQLKAQKKGLLQRML